MTRIVSLAVVLLLFSSALFAGDKREEERVRACGEVAVPPAGEEMVATLRKHSPKNLSDPKSLRTTRKSSQ